MAGKIIRRSVYCGGKMPFAARIKRVCLHCVLKVGLSLLPLAVGAAQFKFPEQTFTVPDGFEIEKVAGPGVVERPISASFDERGRLYVTDSSGSNEKPDKQLEEKPHRVVLLEDTDGDGKFDKSTVFADKMMFPEGCLWFDGALYVAAPPSIWKIANNSTREEWHQGVRERFAWSVFGTRWMALLV